MPGNEDGQSAPKKKFKAYPIGYLHVDFAGVHPHAKRALAAGLRRVPGKLPGGHSSDRICRAYSVEHRLTPGRYS